MKTYQEYYNDWQNSTESRDLSFEEWLMLLLDRKEKEMIGKKDIEGFNQEGMNVITITNWKDVRELFNIADYFLEKFDKKELVQMGESGFYSKVLVKFERFKNMITQQG